MHKNWNVFLTKRERNAKKEKWAATDGRLIKITMNDNKFYSSTSTGGKIRFFAMTLAMKYGNITTELPFLPAHTHDIKAIENSSLVHTQLKPII